MEQWIRDIYLLCKKIDQVEPFSRYYMKKYQDRRLTRFQPTNAKTNLSLVEYIRLKSKGRTGTDIVFKLIDMEVSKILKNGQMD